MKRRMTYKELVEAVFEEVADLAAMGRFQPLVSLVGRDRADELLNACREVSDTLNRLAALQTAMHDYNNGWLRVMSVVDYRIVLGTDSSVENGLCISAGFRRDQLADAGVTFWRQARSEEEEDVPSVNVEDVVEGDVVTLPPPCEAAAVEACRSTQTKRLHGALTMMRKKERQGR